MIGLLRRNLQNFLCKDRYFLMMLGAFYDLFQSEDHPWHAFPDLPRPLASLGRYPGQSIEEKPAVLK